MHLGASFAIAPNLFVMPTRTPRQGKSERPAAQTFRADKPPAYPMRDSAVRCALYARVSRNDHSQDPESQLQPLRNYALANGWTITREYVDRQTGATMDRPELRAMLAGADRREFDSLLFFRFDRLTRTGITDTLSILQELRSYGVDFRSLMEPHISSQGPIGELMVAILATFAEVERQANIERTLAGIERARKDGKTLGRPRVTASIDRIDKLRADGVSSAEIARKLGISRATVNRRLQELRKQHEPTYIR